MPRFNRFHDLQRFFPAGDLQFGKRASKATIRPKNQKFVAILYGRQYIGLTYIIKRASRAKNKIFFAIVHIVRTKGNYFGYL